MKGFIGSSHISYVPFFGVCLPSSLWFQRLMLSQRGPVLEGPTEPTKSPAKLVIVTSMFATMLMLQGGARHSRRWRGFEVAAIRRDRRPLRQHRRKRRRQIRE